MSRQSSLNVSHQILAGLTAFFYALAFVTGVIGNLQVTYTQNLPVVQYNRAIFPWFVLSGTVSLAVVFLLRWADVRRAVPVRD